MSALSMVPSMAETLGKGGRSTPFLPIPTVLPGLDCSLTPRMGPLIDGKEGGDLYSVASPVQRTLCAGHVVINNGKEIGDSGRDTIMSKVIG